MPPPFADLSTRVAARARNMPHAASVDPRPQATHFRRPPSRRLTVARGVRISCCSGRCHTAAASVTSPLASSITPWRNSGPGAASGASCVHETPGITEVQWTKWQPPAGHAHQPIPIPHAHQAPGRAGCNLFVIALEYGGQVRCISAQAISSRRGVRSDEDQRASPSHGRIRPHEEADYHNAVPTINTRGWPVLL